ncbi:MAG: FixH family protein [Alphaproteobacteria bacterium]|nr:FixH family protein [Alphaproteobacteria bacterium]
MIAAALFLAACTGAPPPPAPVEAAPADWGAARATDAGTYRVALKADPVPAIGDLFTMEATVTSPSGDPVPDAAVVLDARMPQHDHGMMTDPKPDPGDCDDAGACRHADGVYRSRGFKLHMAGAWTVSVDIDGPAGRDTATFVYDIH